MSVEMINPKELFDSRQYGFSQIAIASGQKFIYLSGQVGWDKNQQVVGEGDLRAQTWQALENIRTGLTHAGATLANIVSMRIYIVYSEMKNSGAVTEGLLHFFPGDNPPPTTWIGVPGLANKDFLIEIEPVAVL